MVALETSGAVEVRTGRGIFVTGNTESTVFNPAAENVGPFEILELRKILEPEVCARAATKITDTQIGRLFTIVNEMGDENNKAGETEKLDYEFHLLIAKACGNGVMYETVKWMWDLRINSILSNLVLEAIDKEGPCIGEHNNIVSALSQRDPQAAFNAMKIHLEGAKTTIEFDLNAEN